MEVDAADDGWQTASEDEYVTLLLTVCCSVDIILVRDDGGNWVTVQHDDDKLKRRAKGKTEDAEEEYERDDGRRLVTGTADSARLP
jgi:hypothetical protein